MVNCGSPRKHIERMRKDRKILASQPQRDLKETQAAQTDSLSRLRRDRLTPRVRKCCDTGRAKRNVSVPSVLTLNSHRVPPMFLLSRMALALVKPSPRAGVMLRFEIWRTLVQHLKYPASRSGVSNVFKVNLKFTRQIPKLTQPVEPSRMLRGGVGCRKAAALLARRKHTRARRGDLPIPLCLT